MTIFFTSVPKSGTHLLLPVFEAVATGPVHRLDKVRYTDEGVLPDLSEFGLVYGHIRTHPKQGAIDPSIRTIVLIRDPRDVVLSMRSYLFRSIAPSHRAIAEVLRPMDFEQQLMALVDGIRIDRFKIAPLDVYCGGFVEWTQFGGVVLRYEDMLLPDAPERIAEALARPDLVDTIRETMGAHLFVGGTTFNKGGSRWRDEMPAAVLDHINAKSDVIARMGYA